MRPALADAAVASLRPAARFQSRRRQQCLERRLCRLDHGRHVPAALRDRRQDVAALRHLRLEPDHTAGPPGRRRVPGRTCALCVIDHALRISCRSPMTSYDPRITPARPDLAASHLAGKVEATRYVDGYVREI